jgi:hypothetical protein
MLRLQAAKVELKTPSSRVFRSEGVVKWEFVVLAEEAEREIVLGLIGHFWTRSPQIQSLPPAKNGFA